MKQQGNEALAQVAKALDIAFRRGAFNLAEAENVAKNVRILLENDGKHNDQGKGSQDSDPGPAEPGK